MHLLRRAEKTRRWVQRGAVLLMIGLGAVTIAGKPLACNSSLAQIGADLWVRRPARHCGKKHLKDIVAILRINHPEDPNQSVGVKNIKMKKFLYKSVATLGVILFSAGTAGAAAPVLLKGARGTDVAALQRLLTYGGEPVAITALIGPTTEGLIKRFQRRHGLLADGIVGPATWRQLQPTLRRGHAGVAVTALQASLREKFSFSLQLDGIFGPATEAAVRQFQQHMGLGADGIAGPATWEALLGHFEPLELSAPGLYRYGTTNPSGYYGTAHTIASIQEIARQWRARGYSSRLGIGDISLPHGGYIPGHSSHRLGVDVDIRLVRSDGREVAVDYRNSAYSRTRTQELINLLHATGEIEVIFFNDPNVSGVMPWPNHDQHMHVRFKR